MPSSSSLSYNCAKERVDPVSSAGVLSPSPAYKDQHRPDLACILNNIKNRKEILRFRKSIPLSFWKWTWHLAQSASSFEEPPSSCSFLQGDSPPPHPLLRPRGRARAISLLPSLRSVAGPRIFLFNLIRGSLVKIVRIWTTSTDLISILTEAMQALEAPLLEDTPPGDLTLTLPEYGHNSLWWPSKILF